MQVDLSSFSNEEYNPGSPFIRGVWYVVNILVMLNPLNPFVGLKRAALRVFGAEIGENVVIKPRVNIKYPWNLKIGKNSWIGECVWIDNLDEVNIGENVCVSQGALLLSGNHNYKKRSFDLITGQIVLENGAWIGARAVVSNGVIVKSHAVLAVNSVASSNLEAYKIYRGNPAQIIKDRIVEE